MFKELQPRHDNESIWSVAISPNGMLVGTGSRDGTSKIFNNLESSLLFTLYMPKIRKIGNDCENANSDDDEQQINEVYYVEFVSNIEFLTASEDKILRLWNLVNGQIIRCFDNGSNNPINVNKELRRAVIVHNHGKWKVWNLDDNEKSIFDATYSENILSVRLLPTCILFSTTTTIKIVHHHSYIILEEINYHQQLQERDLHFSDALLLPNQDIAFATFSQLFLISRNRTTQLNRISIDRSYNDFMLTPFQGVPSIIAWSKSSIPLKISELCFYEIDESSIRMIKSEPLPELLCQVIGSQSCCCSSDGSYVCLTSDCGRCIVLDRFYCQRLQLISIIGNSNNRLPKEVWRNVRKFVF